MKKGGIDLDFLCANIMMFYNGAISYDNIQNMSIPEILNYNELAIKINEEQKKEIGKMKHGNKI